MAAAGTSIAAPPAKLAVTIPAKALLATKVAIAAGLVLYPL